MQHINDDIDDLLRSAAESYPLKIQGADWESIAGRLSGEEVGIENGPAVVIPLTNSATRYRKYLLAMLLIPAGLILAKYAGLIGGNNGHTAMQPSETAKVAPPTNPKQGSNSTASASKAANKAAVVGQAVAGQATTNTVSTPKNTQADLGSVVAKGGINKKDARFGMHVSNAGIVNGGAAIENKTQSSLPRLSDLPVLQHQQQLAANNNNDDDLGTSHNPAAALGDKINEVTPPIKGGVAPAEPVTPAQAQPQGKTPTPMVHHNTIKGRFYIGAFVAPDYTTVKYQPGSKVGFNYGGVVGYTFMKNLSVEVGIAAGRKYYTSSGKYFNSTESWLSNWGKILNISGYASLTEFPVNLKYDFKTNKDGNFFATAGVVSYIVHQENYNYVLDKNGVIYTRDKSPIVATNDLFANANVSAGYESSLGGLCNFRIEPYYRIPIKGIGIGGLPITSIGLNIGITKKFK